MNTVADSRIFRIKRNLTDAGFNELQIKKFFEFEKENDRISQHRMLKEQKISLLKELHENQYKIDCLDHMIYKIKQEDKKAKEKSNERKAETHTGMGQDFPEKR